MNRDAYGFSFSFLLHASILGACFYLLPALDLQPETLVLDFSIIPETTGPPKIYSAPAEQEKSIKPPPALQVPPIPKQLAIPKPIKKVVRKAPPKPVTAKKALSRPAEKILPKKEEKLFNEESFPVVAENIVPAEPETLSPAPPVQPQVQARGAASLQQSHSAAGASSAAASREVEQHYVKAHFVYIKKIIEKNIIYPPMARRMGWQGKVVVSFIVCSNGEVENLQIVESSGHVQLDRNALETVKQAEPFPRPPVRVKLVLPVTYTIS